MIHNKTLDQITEADISLLVAERIPEGRRLEYKRQLPGDADEEKAKFCAGVTSFANTGGGDILYGIEGDRDADGKSTGRAKSIFGIGDNNFDQQILRLEQILMAGVSPRLPNVPMKGIECEEGKAILVVRVPNSWASPHAVITKGGFRFYGRTSAGKWLMDVDEVRAAFSRSATIGENIRNFRAERLARIRGGETPVVLQGSALTILHLIPFSAFDVGRPFKYFTGEESRRWQYQPLSAHGWDFRYNADGILSFFPHHEPATSYLQAFRQGTMEFVDAGLLLGGEKRIPASAFEWRVHDAVERGLRVFDEEGDAFPVAVLLSLVDVQGYKMAFGNQPPFREPPTIERESVLVPEILIEDPSQDLPRTLRPIFDVVWNAAGLPGSYHYDHEGNWRPRE